MSDPGGLSVSVELLSGRYDAGDAGDRQAAEWPPHPARLFCALVASARGQHDRDALRWLEEQPPPVVVAAATARTAVRSAYVVTNKVEGGGSQTHPGRTNGLRQRASSDPTALSIRFIWEQSAPSADVVAAVDRMAQRIPYLGRSTGVALVSAAAGTAVPDPAPDGCVTFEPCELTRAEAQLRVPYAGYLDDLDALVEAGGPTWQAARFLGYRIRRLIEDEVAGPPSVYSDVVVLRFRGMRPEGRLAPIFTRALRSAVLRRAGDAAPTALHGHGADGRPHVAFLALPHVDAEHAAGHLLGLAVAVPELPVEQLRAVIASVLGLRREGAVTLAVPGVGEVELTYEPGLVRPWTVRPERWRRGSRHWSSATPVVLDRYPKDGDSVTEVRRACATVGLPDPVSVRVAREPLLRGAVRLRPGDLPEKLRGRLFRHVELAFEREVAGPLLLGAGRYLGLGLFAPILVDHRPLADSSAIASREKS